MESLVHELDILNKENKLLHQLIEIYRDHLNAQINRVQTELLEQIKGLQEQLTNHLIQAAQAAPAAQAEKEVQAAPAEKEVEEVPVATAEKEVEEVQAAPAATAEKEVQEAQEVHVTSNLNKRACYCM